MTVAAVAAVLSPSPTLAFSMMAAGPCLAVGASKPRAVAAIGAYAVVLTIWISTAKGLWDMTAETKRLLLIIGVSALCIGLARSRQVAEEHAIESRARLAEIVRSSGDAIITSALDGSITAWNPAAERIYGYTAQEAIGRSIAMLGVTQEEIALMARMTRHHHIDDFVTERKRKDGGPVPVSISIVGLLDRGGRIFEVCATHRDLTAQRSMEARERLMSERSAQAERLESLGRLAGGVAHDFNNLLAIILNYTDFAIEQGAGEGSAQDDLNRVRGAADRARMLCRQLLIFARCEPTDAEPIDLNLILADSRDLLAPMLGEHIELTVHRAKEPLMVAAERTKLDQVLLNLIINARDAMPHGGSVAAEVSAVEIDRGHLGVHPGIRPGHYAELLVRDTGEGMAPEIAAHIFEPFFTTKSKDRGTGLGLATVYGIVTEAGGDIAVESEPGVGTTFRLLLPIAADTAGQATESAPTRPPVAHGQHVLVVEDQDDVRDLVVRILKEHGYAVTAAGDGPSALEQVEHKRFDLLLTDVVMPAMPGPTLANLIQQSQPRLPVLFMSGYTEGLLSADHGVDRELALIQKPFTADELLDRIHHVLAVSAPETAGRR
ncbi:ATP-binding protein [Actinoplanes sp. NPDC049118]|uniref:hybrid sensor histidine kinase/response regulator n=1 Tax=Actinoplanes sp. NPDC049118 TaxID=3155769 RepID=UPI00340226AB